MSRVGSAWATDVAAVAAMTAVNGTKPSLRRCRLMRCLRELRREPQAGRILFAGAMSTFVGEKGLKYFSVVPDDVKCTMF